MYSVNHGAHFASQNTAPSMVYIYEYFKIYINYQNQRVALSDRKLKYTALKNKVFLEKVVHVL